MRSIAKVRKTFTINELLVVVAIIAVLAAIVLLADAGWDGSRQEWGG